MSEISDIESSERPAAPPQAPETKETNRDWWISKLYVLRSKASATEDIAHEDSYLKERHGRGVSQKVSGMASKAEEYMNRPDFDQIRKTDVGYQKLLEEFALLAERRFPALIVSPAAKAMIAPWIAEGASIPLLEQRAKELRAEADKIAAEHNTPRERAQYAIFSVRGFIREMLVRPIKPASVEIPKGISQLVKELGEMDKQVGEYKMELAVPEVTGEEGKERVSGWKRTSSVKKISRLEALTKRRIYAVTPIAPAKPFQTQIEPFSASFFQQGGSL